MSLVDDRGRVGGRVNLVDAFVAFVILVLLPVAYGAYLLFRTPTPKLTSIEPDKLYQGPNLRITIKGANLRPFLRVAFNTIQARNFLIGSTTSAQIDLPDLAPGTYDVQLFDYMQEVDRLPKALTILPFAPVSTLEMEVTGAFIGLPSNVIPQFQPGLRFSRDPSQQNAVLVSVGAAAPARVRVRTGGKTVEVPVAGETELQATLRLWCYVAPNPDGSLRCMVPGAISPAAVAPDSNLELRAPHGWVNFQVTEAHAPSSGAPK